MKRIWKQTSAGFTGGREGGDLQSAIPDRKKDDETKSGPLVADKKDNVGELGVSLRLLQQRQNGLLSRTRMVVACRGDQKKKGRETRKISQERDRLA